MRKYQSISFDKVAITGEFWGERLDTILKRTIPSQYAKLEEHGILESLKLKKPVPPLRIPRDEYGFTTQIFWDSDVGKWVEAASFALSHGRDADIEAKIEAIIDDLEAGQAEDGYLNFWYLQHEPENRWTNLRDNHELYNAGHLLEGAVAYYRATGRRRFLDIMIRYIDHIASVFGTGEGQKRGYPGHQEIEMALIKLFDVTGEVRFLELALYFIDERGVQPHYFEIEREARGEAFEAFRQGTHEYSQSHIPVREQTKVVGHAVRAMYMYAAMADLAAETGDDALKSACEALWKDIVETRMYVTGGFGPSASNEGFTEDYDLPNDTAYAETCASVAMVFWASRMLNLELDGQYAEVMERALFNNCMAGLSIDGEHYFYDNKLASHGESQRWAWHHCPCCTMNVARLVASIAGYIYSVSSDEIAMHFYGGSETNAKLGGVDVGIQERSNYPWNGQIEIAVEPENAAEFTLALRIPDWANEFSITLNGEELQVKTSKGYAKIKRQWNAGDKIMLNLPITPERVYANIQVEADYGRVSLARGPLVYCVEQIDQSEDAALEFMRLPRNALLSSASYQVLNVDIESIQTTGLLSVDDFGHLLYRNTPAEEIETNLRAIPYYLWANRGANAMRVWIPE